MRTVSAYAGLPLTIASSASHALRATSFGAVADAVVRSPTFETGLRTVSARTRVTRPTVRTSRATACPTHTGVLIRQPARRRRSALDTSGPSWSPSSTAVHADQRSEADFVRSSSRPGPRQ